LAQVSDPAVVPDCKSPDWRILLAFWDWRVLPMDFRDGLSALLPPPRDDEPASLRQDIIDELSDHLVCAYHRELLRGLDSNLARQRVLERFGDPASVARRLWLDAMRGKIMTQRVLIATCLVVTLVSLSLAGTIWHQSSVAQRNAASAAAAAMHAMAVQNEKAQAIQQEMLQQMRAMSESIRSTRSLDWNPVTFTVTQESPAGPPLAGVSIALEERASGSRGVEMGGGATKPTWRVTDSAGSASFGVVHPGDYAFRVFKDWDHKYLTAFGELSIEPGSQVNKRIVCPKSPLEQVPVRVRAAWPADLEKEKLVLYASFDFIPIQLDSRSWTLCEAPPANPPDGNRFPLFAWGLRPANRTIICGPGPSIAELGRMRPYFWALSDRPDTKVWADVRHNNVRDIGEAAKPVEWERGNDGLSGVVVLRPTESAAGNASTRRFEVLFVSQPRDGNRNMGINFVVDKPPPVDDVAGPRPKTAHRVMSPAHMGQLSTIGSQQLLWDSWSLGQAPFAARPGQINEYTITLPKELINAVREKLKADQSPKPE
jgi:hypothetical protein